MDRLCSTMVRRLAELRRAAIETDQGLRCPALVGGVRTRPAVPAGGDGLASQVPPLTTWSRALWQRAIATAVPLTLAVTPGPRVDFEIFVSETGFAAGGAVASDANGAWSRDEMRTFRDPGFPQEGDPPEFRHTSFGFRLA